VPPELRGRRLGVVDTSPGSRIVRPSGAGLGRPAPPSGYRRRLCYRVLLIGITFWRTRLLWRLRPRRASSNLPRTACLTSEPERGARSNETNAPMPMPMPKKIKAVFAVSEPPAALLYSPYLSYWFIASSDAGGPGAVCYRTAAGGRRSSRLGLRLRSIEYSNSGLISSNSAAWLKHRAPPTHTAGVQLSCYFAQSGPAGVYVDLFSVKQACTWSP